MLSKMIGIKATKLKKSCTCRVKFVCSATGPSSLVTPGPRAPTPTRWETVVSLLRKGPSRTEGNTKRTTTLTEQLNS